MHTLSPIPSSSSLSTLKTSGVRMRRHSESARRVSLQSKSFESSSFVILTISIVLGMTPSDRSTISPAGSISGKLSHQDMVGYAILRSIRSSRITRPLYTEDEFADIFAPESLMTSVSQKPYMLSNMDNQNPSRFVMICNINVSY